VKVVVQRCDSGSLLVDADSSEERWVEVQKALVIYVSFAKGSTEEKLPKIVKTLLSLPLITSGAAGWASHKDASEDQVPRSVLELAKAGASSEENKISVVVIPQAGLTSKISQGKILKYRDQCDKALGGVLYERFVSLFNEVARLEIEGKSTSEKAEEAARLRAARNSLADVAPSELFKTDKYKEQYAGYTFDERGVPLASADGEPVPKSQKKKLEKIYAVQVKKFAKVQAAAEAAGGAAGPPKETGTEGQEGGKEQKEQKEQKEEKQEQKKQEKQKKQYLQVVAGTFGGRQGFRMQAECGPFVHMFAF
jgi:D-Tyr-tRNAtyr deacylase